MRFTSTNIRQLWKHQICPLCRFEKTSLLTFPSSYGKNKKGTDARERVNAFLIRISIFKEIAKCQTITANIFTIKRCCKFRTFVRLLIIVGRRKSVFLHIASMHNIITNKLRNSYYSSQLRVAHRMLSAGVSPHFRIYIALTTVTILLIKNKKSYDWR